MALGKITKAIVEKLPPGHWLWDADHREVVKGFGARRQVDGVFYYLRYPLHGRQRIKSMPSWLAIHSGYCADRSQAHVGFGCQQRRSA